MSNFLLGIGLTGLAFYDELEDKSNLVAVDKNTEYGGYTRTIKIDSYKFDYTGHFLHLRKFERPSSIGSRGEQFINDWEMISKKSSVFIDSRLCEAPYQYNFGQLGIEHTKKAVNSFKLRSKNISDNCNLEDFFLSKFGDYMCQKFFIPYSEKLYGLPLKDLSCKQVSRFFPDPNDKLIIEQLDTRQVRAETYNSKFWYPKLGGIDLLLKHFSFPKNAIFSTPNGIDIKNKKISFNDGSIYNFKNLVSTIPLNILYKLCNNLSISNQIKLSASTQYVVHIGTRQQIDALDQNAWIYIPDKETNLYRVGNYTFASKYMSGRQSGMSLYLELSGKSLDPIEEAIDYMRKNFDLNTKDIEVTTLSKLNPAYVHFIHGQEDLLSDLKNVLNENCIYSIGRYGSWDYVSMEDCIVQAKQLANLIK